DKKAVEKKRQAIQYRGTVLHQMIRDVQRYAELDRGNGPDKDMKKIEDESLAFRLGLVFRATRKVDGVPLDRNDKLCWLHNAAAGTSKLRQRSARESKDVDSYPIEIVAFNKFEHSFAIRPPSLSGMRKYEHEKTVALAWDLSWGGSGQKSEENPEHH